MKPVRAILLPLLLIPALSTSLAAKPAPEACAQAIDTLATSSTRHPVSRSSNRVILRKNHTFWINSSSAGDHSERRFKSKCVTSADGGVVSLRVEPGRWK